MNDFKPNVAYKQIIDNEKLCEIFSCDNYGNIRISKQNNVLVLITDNYSKYLDGIWYIKALGDIGDQSLAYSYNSNVHNANYDNTSLYLFVLKNENEYQYLGRVFILDTIKQREKDREVYYFLLNESGNIKNVINFLSEKSEIYLSSIDVLDSGNTLFYKSVKGIIDLMKEEGIDTLIGPGGWFLNLEGYYFNNNSDIKSKSGKVSLDDRNTVFKNQNKFLNPFYEHSLVYKKKERLPIFDKEKSNGFRLLYLSFLDDREQKIEIDFLDLEENIINNEVKKSPFKSLIIGPNGIGKSSILSKIQKNFYELYRLSDSKVIEPHMIKSDYEIHYMIGKNIVKIKSLFSKKEFLLNDKTVAFSSEFLPNKMLAVSMLLNDKFNFIKSDPEKQNNSYEYLGIKSSSNAAMLGKVEKAVFENLLFTTTKKEFNRDLKGITDFLQVKPIIRIQFKVYYPEVFIKDNIFSLKQKIKEKMPYKKLSAQEIEDIKIFIELLNEKQSHLSFNKDIKKFFLIFDLKNTFEYTYMLDLIKVIKLLIKYNIIEYEDLQLKKDRYFSLNIASSGENQFFNTMVRILSKIEQDSIILIDEPEVSLHPNWQYKYISGINDIFKNYPSCHFVIATHSHFMVSDIEPNFSSIISVRFDKDNLIKTHLHRENTFGWSPDDILYNIFFMKSSRNHFLEMDLRELLYLISHQSKDLGRIEKHIEKSENLTLKVEDPLFKIINKAKGYLQNAQFKR